MEIPQQSRRTKEEVLEAAVKKRQLLPGPDRGQGIPPADRNTLCPAGGDPPRSVD